MLGFPNEQMVASAKIKALTRASVAYLDRVHRKLICAMKDEATLLVAFESGKGRLRPLRINSIVQQDLSYKAAKRENCQRAPVVAPIQVRIVQTSCVQLDDSVDGERHITAIRVYAPTRSNEGVGKCVPDQPADLISRANIVIRMILGSRKQSYNRITNCPGHDERRSHLQL